MSNRAINTGQTFALALILVGTGLPVAAPADALEPVREQLERDRQIEARVWLDRGVDPVLRYGERTRIYYRVSEDAYVAIFHIDTNGTVRIAYPRSATDVHRARGGTDYRLLFPDSPYWYVNDAPGVGYFFIVASPTPMDFSAFRHEPSGGSWDLTRVGQQVYRDPYVAMDDYVSYLVPDWEYEVYALDFSAYHVGQTYSFPRFLCYDCHGYQSFASWNPYHYSCSSFRVVVYNDPYFYPSTRYRGSRVVYVRPPAPRQPQFVFKERATGEPGTPMVQSRPPFPDRTGGERTPAGSRAQDPRGASGGAGAAQRVAPPGMPADEGRGGSEARRPSGVLPGGGAPGRAAPPPRAGAGAGSQDRRPPTGIGAPGEEGRPPRAAPGASGRDAPPPAATPPAGGERRRPVLERRAPVSTPPVRNVPPPPARNTPPPPARSDPSGARTPPPAPASRPPVRNDPPPPARSSPPPASSSPPPARDSRPPPARNDPPPARRPPPRPPGGGSTAFAAGEGRVSAAAASVGVGARRAPFARRAAPSPPSAPETPSARRSTGGTSPDR